MTIEQLKAHAYDCVATIEAWQQELVKTRQAIQEEMSKQQSSEPKKEEKKEEEKKNEK